MTYPIDFFFCRASDVDIIKYCYLDQSWNIGTLNTEKAMLPYRIMDAAAKKAEYDAANAAYIAGTIDHDALKTAWDTYDHAQRYADGTPRGIATLQQAVDTYPERSVRLAGITWDQVYEQHFKPLPDRFNAYLRQYGFEYDYTVAHVDLGMTQRELYTSKDQYTAGQIEGDPSCGTCLQNAEPAGQGISHNNLYGALYAQRPWASTLKNQSHWREEIQADGSALNIGRVVSATIEGGGDDAGYPPSQPGDDCGKGGSGSWAFRRTVSGVNDNCAALWGFASEDDLHNADTFHEMGHAMDVWNHPNDSIPEDNGYKLTWLNVFPTIPGGFLSPGQLAQLETWNVPRFLRKVTPVPLPPPPVEPPPVVIPPLKVTPTSITLGLVTNRSAVITASKPSLFSLIGRAATIQMQDSLTATVFAQRKGGATVGVKSGDEIIYVQVNVKRW